MSVGVEFPEAGEGEGVAVTVTVSVTVIVAVAVGLSVTVTVTVGSGHGTILGPKGHVPLVPLTRVPPGKVPLLNQVAFKALPFHC